MSKPIDKKTARDMFIDHLKSVVQYWKNESRASDADSKLDGVLHSFLCVLDGVSSHPSIDLVLRPHPDDKAYHEEQDEDYYVDVMVINDDVMLHDLLYKDKK